MDGCLSGLKPVVYLAGPYSKPDPVENMHRAIKIADGLLDVCVPMVPHLTGIWHMVSPKPYPVWLALDLALMARCDYVYRFDGDSSGADGEVAEAQRLEIPVAFTEAALRDLCSRWESPDFYGDDDGYEAFIRDMGACVECPKAEGCPIGTCLRASQPKVEGASEDFGRVS